MIIVPLLSPGPWLVGTTKVYSGVGADIVMESITLADQRGPILNSDSDINCNRGDCDHDSVDETLWRFRTIGGVSNKGAFRFERVFETQALSCGKIFSHGTSCKLNPKTS